MIDFLTRDWVWKLASLAAAMLLWVTFADQPGTVTFISVPVEYQEMPADLEISSAIIDSVTLEVKGSARTLYELGDTRPGVVLSLAGVHSTGEKTLNITQENVKLPPGVDLVRAVPSQVRLQFERRAERQVPVEVRFAGSPPSGYRVGKVTVNPPNLILIGPEGRVSGVDKAVTDPVNLSSVVGSAEFRVNAFVSDPQVRFRSASRVVVRVAMEKR
ncbi:MAG: CdaR family protein [Bryobacteraceae bacterium]